MNQACFYSPILKKAFDSIDHEFIRKTMDHFNFGDTFKQWIKLFYKSPMSCIVNNGFHTDFFKIERGVRQGCPLSPYMFILSIELLSHAIRKK